MEKPQEIVHRNDPRVPGFDAALCGNRGRTMSWHEITRGRITCSDCLLVYGEQERERERERVRSARWSRAYR